MTNEVLRNNYDISAAGSKGIVRTRARIAEKIYWYHMDDVVNSFLLSCQESIKNKKRVKYGRAPM